MLQDPENYKPQGKTSEKNIPPYPGSVSSGKKSIWFRFDIYRVEKPELSSVVAGFCAFLLSIILVKLISSGYWIIFLFASLLAAIFTVAYLFAYLDQISGRQFNVAVFFSILVCGGLTFYLYREMHPPQHWIELPILMLRFTFFASSLYVTARIAGKWIWKQLKKSKYGPIEEDVT
jgi:hypothetical protein